MKNISARLTKIIAIFLAFAMFFSFGTSVLAAEEVRPYANDYIRDAYASMSAQGNGKLAISLSLAATAVMGQLGVSGMIVYESTDQTNWSTVGYYTYNTHSNLIAYNTQFFNATLTQNGVAGRYYKAQVSFWAGNGGTGDSRIVTTSIVRAT